MKGGFPGLVNSVYKIFKVGGNVVHKEIKEANGKTVVWDEAGEGDRCQMKEDKSSFLIPQTVENNKLLGRERGQMNRMTFWKDHFHCLVENGMQGNKGGGRESI